VRSKGRQHDGLGLNANGQAVGNGHSVEVDPLHCSISTRRDPEIGAEAGRNDFLRPWNRGDAEVDIARREVDGRDFVAGVVRDVQRLPVRARLDVMRQRADRYPIDVQRPGIDHSDHVVRFGGDIRLAGTLRDTDVVRALSHQARGEHRSRGGRRSHGQKRWTRTQAESRH
jgi:hypothetical protein